MQTERKGMDQEKVEGLKRDMHQSSLALTRTKRSLLHRKQKLKDAVEAEDFDAAHKLEKEISELSEKIRRDQKDLIAQQDVLRESWVEGG